MADTLDRTTNETIRQLELRVRRIEFALAGSCEDVRGELRALHSADGDATVYAQLLILERQLLRLREKSPTVKDILDLNAKFPEIFKGPLSADASDSALSSSEKAAVVMSKAPEYSTASSQLTAVVDTPIPDPKMSAELIALLPRIQRAEVVHKSQAQKVAELRLRSAALLERWFLIGIEGLNECFAEWDERTFVVEKELAQRMHHATADV